MAKLGISKKLFDDLPKLEPRLRAKVSEQSLTFAGHTAQELRNHKGLHLERHKNSRDERARTIRLDDNHRGIVLDLGNESFVLTMVGTHDETDRWMAKNSFGVNAATGAFEIINFEAIEGQIAATPEPTGDGHLFEHRRDKDFTQLGVLDTLVPTLRAFTDEDQLLGLLELLPQNQMDAVVALLGEETVEGIYAQIAGSTDPEKIDVDDVAASLEAPASRQAVHVFTDNEELAAMLAQPLKQWRVFLHESQHSFAYRPVYNGPARVTGGAGTGKTVVAVHRAKALAAQLDDRSGKPILFTTFTRNLAQAIELDVRALGGAELLDVVEVANIDRISFRIVQEAEGSQPRRASNHDVRQAWTDVVDERGLDFTPEFLNNEWEQVILANGCRSRDEYLQVARTGRGIPLDRRSRAKVWKAVETFTQYLADSGMRTYLQLAAAATGYVQARSVKPYRHVVVDEAQDLHETQWRLIRALVDEGPNDLFLVGDSHQRIYDRRSSLSSVGIDIRGRSKKLKINYRTTHEIMRWSMRLLGDGSFDDLDDGVDDASFAGYYSYLQGPEPEMSGHNATSELNDALAAQVAQWIADGVPDESIGVASRVDSSFDAIERALKGAGVQCTLLGRDLPIGDGVRMGTMHRMKGLEFQRVAVVDVDDLTMPLQFALTDKNADEVQHRVDLQRELCLLYVACTRARDGLWVGWAGKPSRYLGAVTASS